MSFPVSGLLTEVPADAQMTSLGTSLSPREITNGGQPRVPAAPESHNSFLGFSMDLENRHYMLQPWPSPSCCLLFLIKREWGMLGSPKSVLCNHRNWASCVQQTLFAIYPSSWANRTQFFSHTHPSLEKTVPPPSSRNGSSWV